MNLSASEIEGMRGAGMGGGGRGRGRGGGCPPDILRFCVQMAREKEKLGLQNLFLLSY